MRARVTAEARNRQRKHGCAKLAMERARRRKEGREEDTVTHPGDRFTGSKFQGLESPPRDHPPRRGPGNYFSKATLPRRSRRSNRTENTEPRTDNGWSGRAWPPGASILQLRNNATRTQNVAFIDRSSFDPAHGYF